MRFDGSCHCEALAYAYETALPIERWTVRSCQCSFCRAHGTITTSDPDGRVEFHVRDEQALQRYRFGLRTADFLLCSRCGVYIGAQTATDRGAFAIVNTRALRPCPATLPEPVPAEYGAEDRSNRVRRRSARWTPLARLV